MRKLVADLLTGYLCLNLRRIMQWIPFKQRQPSEGQYIHYKGDGDSFGHGRFNAGVLTYWRHRGDINAKPTHWSPTLERYNVSRISEAPNTLPEEAIR